MNGVKVAQEVIGRSASAFPKYYWLHKLSSVKSVIGIWKKFYGKLISRNAAVPILTKNESPGSRKVGGENIILSETSSKSINTN